jgi:hypothetical protein
LTNLATNRAVVVVVRKLAASSHSALPPGESRVEIGRKLIAAMKEAKMPQVYGFVNGVRTEEQPPFDANVEGVAQCAVSAREPYMVAYEFTVTGG